MNAGEPGALGRVLDALGRLECLDGLARALTPSAAGVGSPGSRREQLLRGRSLGHPVHPAATDIPIGCWMAASLLDVGGQRTARPAAALTAIGLAGAVPAAATGLADWRALTGSRRRLGALHATVNLAATAGYAVSLLLRLTGHRRAGVATGATTGAVLGLGALLGGHVAFGLRAGPGKVPRPAPPG